IGEVVLWDFASRKTVATRSEHTGFVTSVSVAPDGKTFVTTSADRTVNVWDAATFEVLARLRGHVGEVWCGAISPDGRTVVSGGAEGVTKLWSTDTRHADKVLEDAAAVVGFLKGGRQLLAAGTNGVSLWTPENGARKDFVIPSNLGIIQGVASK